MDINSKLTELGIMTITRLSDRSLKVNTGGKYEILC